MKPEIIEHLRGVAEFTRNTARSVGRTVIHHKAETLFCAAMTSAAVVGISAIEIGSRQAVSFNSSIDEKTTNVPSGLPSQEAYDKAVKIITDLRNSHFIIPSSVDDEMEQFRNEYVPNPDINKKGIADTGAGKIAFGVGIGLILTWVTTYVFNPFHWNFIREVGGFLERKPNKAKPLVNN